MRAPRHSSKTASHLVLTESLEDKILVNKKRGGNDSTSSDRGRKSRRGRERVIGKRPDGIRKEDNPKHGLPISNCETVSHFTSQEEGSMWMSGLPAYFLPGNSSEKGQGGCTNRHFQTNPIIWQGILESWGKGEKPGRREGGAKCDCKPEKRCKQEFRKKISRNGANCGGGV